MKKVCIIGFGGIAQSVHMAAYRYLEGKGKAKIVAACDVDPNRFSGGVQINIGGGDDNAAASLNTYTDIDEMLEKENPDLVDICVPTYVHEDITVHVLKKGYHVMCEKPMSLSYDKCQNMIAVAKKAGKQLMIGQCVRFFPEYAYLKELLDAGTYGKPLSAVFRRLSPPPMWGWQNWFMNAELSGGALTDLHIHDLDFVRFAFGEPKAVSCNGQKVYTAGYDVAHSTLYYDDFTVLAIGDWSLENVPFQADYMVSLEKATVCAAGGTVTVYPRGAEAFTPEISTVDGYSAEIEYLVDIINGEIENTKNRPESAALSVKLVETLIDSANKNGEKISLD